MSIKNHDTSLNVLEVLDFALKFQIVQAET